MGKQTRTVWKCDCCGTEQELEYGKDNPVGWGEFTLYIELGFRRQIFCPDCCEALRNTMKERLEVSLGRKPPWRNGSATDL